MSNEFIAFDPHLTDENRGQHILILAIVFSILIILSTLSRIILKLVTRVGLKADDYFNTITLAFNLTANALEIQSVQAGFGRHLQFLTRDQVLKLKRLSQYNILFAAISLWAVKISICFFIRALIHNVHRRATWIIYGLMTVTTVATFCQGVFWGLQATPLKKLWTPDIPGEIKPMKTLVQSIIIFTVINSITDLFYAISPIYFFGRLQMSLKKRLIIIALTGSGLLVFAASITRVGFDGDFYDPDFTWALHNVYMCTVIERNIAEIIADLPANHNLFRNLHKKTQTVLSRGTRDSNKGSSANGLFGSTGKHLATPLRRHVLSNNESTYNDDDEIPLNDSVSVPKDDRIITLQTTIDVETHRADIKEQERNTHKQAHPWDEMGNNA
ncbi:hypothetical protein M434DRAFT_34949 [Hypoxylon sp. CO27-5]|nr:hypothetical protein M434DRAFT_34949 [Hypoxylon sp. CO27-5]